MSEIESNFIADKDIVDSIKMEYSSAIPFEQQEVEELCKELKDELINSYGKYITKNRAEIMDTQIERVVVLNSKDFNDFMSDWLPEDASVNNKPAGGRYIKNGNLLILADQKAQAEDIAGMYKDEWDKLGEQAFPVYKNYIRYSLLAQAVLHEYVHSGQKLENEKNGKDNIRRYALDECGASYITQKFVNEKFKFIIPLTTYTDDVRTKFFEKLIKKYGEDPTCNILFYNTPDDPKDKERFEKTKMDIYSEFTPEELVKMGIITWEQADTFESMQ